MLIHAKFVYLKLTRITPTANSASENSNSIVVIADFSLLTLLSGAGMESLHFSFAQINEDNNVDIENKK